jgi:transposase
MRLSAKGVDITTIARRLQVSRPLVYRYLQMTTPPTPKQPRPSPLDLFIPFILQRWNDGVRNAQQIWRELTTQGYTHSVSTVGRFVKQLRRESAVPYKFKQVEAAPIYEVTAAHRPKPLSAIHVACIVLRRPDQRTQQEQEWLSQLRAAEAEIDQMCQLVEDFCQLVRTRQSSRLDAWIAVVAETHLPMLRSFGKRAAQRGIGAARWGDVAFQSGADRRTDPQAQADQTPGLWTSRVPFAASASSAC